MIGHNLANYTCPIDGTATAVGWTQTDLLKNKVGRPCLGLPMQGVRAKFFVKPESKPEFLNHAKFRML